MLNFDIEKMLFTIEKKDHSPDVIREILCAHPEVKLVSISAVTIRMKRFP